MRAAFGWCTGVALLVLGVSCSESSPVATPLSQSRPSSAAEAETNRGFLVVDVAIGDQCPHEPRTPDPSCSPVPMAGVQVGVRRPGGQPVAEARTGEQGRVTFRLAGGHYVVTGAQLEGYEVTPSQGVAVSAGRRTSVRLTYGHGFQ